MVNISRTFMVSIEGVYGYIRTSMVCIEDIYGKAKYLIKYINKSICCIHKVHKTTNYRGHLWFVSRTFMVENPNY